MTQQQFEELKSLIQGNAQGISRNYEMIGRMYEEHGGRLTRLEVRQEQFSDDLRAVAEGVTGNGERLDRLEGRFDGLEERFDHLEVRFDGLEGRFDHLEVRFDGLEGRFGHLEVRFDGLEGRFDHLEVRFDGLEGRFGHLEEGFDRFGVKFDQLSSSVEAGFTDHEQRLRAVED